MSILCFTAVFFRLYESEPIHQPDLVIDVGVMGSILNIIGLCLFSGNDMFDHFHVC